MPSFAKMEKRLAATPGMFRMPSPYTCSFVLSASTSTLRSSAVVLNSFKALSALTRSLDRILNEILMLPLNGGAWLIMSMFMFFFARALKISDRSLVSLGSLPMVTRATL